MVEQTMAVEAELMTIIEALKDVSPEEREAAYSTLEKDHGVEAVARARALLAIEGRGAEITAGLDAADAANPGSIPEPEPAENVTGAERMQDEVAVEFHENDFAPQLSRPPTINEKQRMLEGLADIWSIDPIKYAEGKKEAADRLGVSQDTVERAVKQIRDGRPKEEEQSQATRLMAIGFAEWVKLWHSPDGQGHASVLADGHWEHYRIKSNAFEGWLRGEYGRVNQVKVGARWVPQVPGTQAVRD